MTDVDETTQPMPPEGDATELMAEAASMLREAGFAEAAHALSVWYFGHAEGLEPEPTVELFPGTQDALDGLTIRPTPIEVRGGDRVHEVHCEPTSCKYGDPTCPVST